MGEKLAVRVHCGSAHVKGKARSYAYFVASIFKTKTTWDGRLIWVNTGINTKPRRSMEKCEREGQDLAQVIDAMFIEGYGSLHNQKVA